jgi:hypothetical protein
MLGGPARINVTEEMCLSIKVPRELIKKLENMAKDGRMRNQIIELE